MTDWLSVTEAAEKSGYSAYHIRQLCREGKLETVKKGLLSGSVIGKGERIGNEISNIQ